MCVTNYVKPCWPGQGPRRTSQSWCCSLTYSCIDWILKFASVVRTETRNGLPAFTHMNSEMFGGRSPRWKPAHLQACSWLLRQACFLWSTLSLSLSQCPYCSYGCLGFCSRTLRNRACFFHTSQFCNQTEPSSNLVGNESHQGVVPLIFFWAFPSGRQSLSSSSLSLFLLISSISLD